MTTRADMFARFVADEEPALEQLRVFIGGEVENALDGSLASLSFVDRFLDHLLQDGNWESLQFFDGLRPRPWLAVRVAYYLALCLKHLYAVEWSMGSNPGSKWYELPVLVIRGIELCPLEIAEARLRSEVAGGLGGLVDDLGREVERANG